MVVAAVDGTTDEFNLRTGPADVAGVAGAAGYTSARRYGDQAAPTQKWAPWNEPWAGGPNAQGGRPQKTAAPRKKAKTLFDLLFN